jgi:hypothetical protein
MQQQYRAPGADASAAHQAEFGCFIGAARTGEFTAVVCVARILVGVDCGKQG